ncbi:hypothetical protein [Kutzneria albida]|uniref:Uncharacterized protein n=1 Tax=Kutzneria albida DSM 43870 TaxID=1449976 RepID=W5WK66_9PSEU|nr:hypothetical protein [Kutzneria albida]AHH98574.1 hypothetical protein KALB_5212 [Kutzneria albida DSM 43870]
MHIERWIRGPIGMDADRRVTRAGCHTVLVTVPTVAAGTRLLDLLMLLEGDHRLQVLFTVPEATGSWQGTTEYVRDLGPVLVPWQQATQHHFDLVLAASYAELEQVHGRVLVVPHGASSLMSRRFSRSAGSSALPHTGLARETLTHRGRLIPSVVALTHDKELEALSRSCPEALPNALVVGDICFDRMMASQPIRDRYRQALGVCHGQHLITVSSTWSTESAFGQHPLLCEALLAQLPRSEYRVALVLHPSVWAVHGRWQIRTWLASCIRAGLLVVPPEQGWQAAMVASDWVIGDHGSTTQYAAALGTPVLLASYPQHSVRPGSIAAAVAALAPTLDIDKPVISQLDRAMEVCGIRSGTIAELITSRPAQSARLLRTAMYRLLNLAEPAHQAVAPPVASPCPIRL